MSDSGIDPVAVTALIISLVALLATCGQLLQQYFATADGHRRCQPSVMGLWGTKTTLKWRWREFRFETIYYVPRLSVTLLRNQYVSRDATTLPFPPVSSKAWHAEWSDNGASEVAARGKTPDCDKTYVISGYIKNEHWWQPTEAGLSREAVIGGGEVVCWVPLLDRIRRVQEQMNTIYPFPSVLQIQQEEGQPTWHMYEAPTAPCIRIQRRSWDFMPPDVVRPLCLSTISDIATLAVRLGMEWREFDPAAGKLRAEGLGHLITSRIVRSMGVVLEYMIVDSSAHHGRRIKDVLKKSYLPVIGVDDLIFGIVPGNVLFDCWDQNIGTISNINLFLELLEESDPRELHLVSNLSRAMKQHPGWVPGLNDVIPLTAPKMSCKVSPLNNLPMPNSYHPGLLRTAEGLQVFCAELRSFVSVRGTNASVQSQQVLRWIEALSQYEQWTTKDTFWATGPYIPTFGLPTGETSQKPTLSYHGDILDFMHRADEYLRHINTHPTNKYNHLMSAHLRMSICANSRITSRQIDEDIPLFSGIAPTRLWLAKTMREYWQSLDSIVSDLEPLTGWNREQVEDAWITMIFRAFCWHHCHRLIDTKIVLPSEWHGSKMPVYIG